MSAAASSSRNPMASGTTSDRALPTAFYLYPLPAACLGLVIGMSRGGTRARERFQAENAHRPPNSMNELYFYTKTRNYRVMLGAIKGGSRYAGILGGATLAFVAMEEGAGVLRERYFGVQRTRRDLPAEQGSAGTESMKRHTWREGEVGWEDGLVAGGLMGIAVGSLYRLPRALFIRSVMLGLVMGGTTSGLQSLQGRLRGLKDHEIAQKAGGKVQEVREEVPLATPESLVSFVKRDEEEERLAQRSKAERLLSPEQMVIEPPKSMWSGLRSWIPGLRDKGEE